MAIPNTLTDFSKLTETEKMMILGLAVTDLRTKTDKHEKILITGEGDTLPLPETVRNHDTYIIGLKYWGRLIGGALLIQTLTFFFGVVVAIVRFLPVLEKIAKQP